MSFFSMHRPCERKPFLSFEKKRYTFAQKIHKESMTMKHILPIAALVLLLLAGFSCHKEEVEGAGACDFDHPLTDLPWLKALTDERMDSADPSRMEIYQCTYQNGKIGFIVNPCMECFVLWQNLYSCEGELLLTTGNLLMEEAWQIRDQELIWQYPPSIIPSD
jgi:hypothetical protein